MSKKLQMADYFGLVTLVTSFGLMVAFLF